jgi:phage shock protein PspC (stress-responsive transcriptional regulator)
MTQQPFGQQQPNQSGGPYAGPPNYKPLRRSRDDRVVAGICAGVGRYLGIDPVAARVLFVVLAIFSGGTALIAYVIAWIVMPEDPADPWAAQSQPAYPPAAAYHPPAYAHTDPTASATAPAPAPAASQPADADTADAQQPTGTGFPEEPAADAAPRDDER